MPPARDRHVVGSNGEARLVAGRRYVETDERIFRDSSAARDLTSVADSIAVPVLLPAVLDGGAHVLSVRHAVVVEIRSLTGGISVHVVKTEHVDLVVQVDEEHRLIVFVVRELHEAQPGQ